MKFERPKGFMGSMPRKWIDKNLPTCPFCKTPSLWELAMEFKFTGYNRYHFRCPNCTAIISAPVPAVSQTFGLHSLVASKNIKVESVGGNQNLQHLVGAEHPLEILQEWARRTHEGETDKQEVATTGSYCGKCGNPLASNEKFCGKCGAQRD